MLCRLPATEITAIVRNGIHASLMTAAEKVSVLSDIDRVLAESP